MFCSFKEERSLSNLITTEFKTKNKLICCWNYCSCFFLQQYNFIFLALVLWWIILFIADYYITDIMAICLSYYKLVLLLVVLPSQATNKFCQT